MLDVHQAQQRLAHGTAAESDGQGPDLDGQVGNGVTHAAHIISGSSNMWGGWWGMVQVQAELEVLKLRTAQAAAC